MARCAGRWHREGGKKGASGRTASVRRLVLQLCQAQCRTLEQLSRADELRTPLDGRGVRCVRACARARVCQPTRSSVFSVCLDACADAQNCSGTSSIVSPLKPAPPVWQSKPRRNGTRRICCPLRFALPAGAPALRDSPGCPHRSSARAASPCPTGCTCQIARRAGLDRIFLSQFGS